MNSCSGGSGVDPETGLTCTDCEQAALEASELLGKHARIQPAGTDIKKTISNLLTEVRDGADSD